MMHADYRPSSLRTHLPSHSGQSPLTPRNTMPSLSILAVCLHSAHDRNNTTAPYSYFTLNTVHPTRCSIYPGTAHTTSLGYKRSRHVSMSRMVTSVGLRAKVVMHRFQKVLSDKWNVTGQSTDFLASPGIKPGGITGHVRTK
jgi:hypothetical protein